MWTDQQQFLDFNVPSSAQGHLRMKPTVDMTCLFGGQIVQEAKQTRNWFKNDFFSLFFPLPAPDSWSAKAKMDPSSRKCVSLSLYI